MHPTPQQRMLAPFPGPWAPEDRLPTNRWLQELLIPGSPGYLIHAGPGSGKSTLLQQLANDLAADHRAVALGPFDMSPYRGQTHADLLLCNLTERIREAAAPHASIPFSCSMAPDSPAPVLIEALSRALTALTDAGVQRVILLLDDFDDIHPWAAVSLANHLRVLFEEHKNHFSFVLTAESDLHELRDTDHVYSPLPNVSISYHLLDLDEDQLRRYALKRSEGSDRPLSEDDLDSLWHQTRGYPALVDAILGSHQRGRLAGSEYSVEDAIKSCMRARSEPEPIGTAVRRVEELTNLNVRDFHPARVLHQLTLGTSPTVNDRGARVLLAMGVLGWRGRRHITWRNPLVQTFWEDSEHGQRLIKGWIQRPISTQQGVLRAEGAVLVSLFLDFGDLVAPNKPAKFDSCRGNQQWINNLRKLGKLRKDFPPGAFALWSEQEGLTNVGHDLNLFRQQIVEHSFMPIYEAGVKDVNLDLDGLLSRFGDRLNPNVYSVAKETLEEEWRRWDSVRLQLTRDGAVHVTLVRDLTAPYPLMKLLDELLGLERELNGGELLELSVQWELALAATQAFLRQVAGERFPEIPALLGLKWEGFSQIKETGSIYPLRDRYVTYLLRKICNCHSDKARSNEQRRQISIVDLEPLQNVATLGDDDQPEAYTYGCEIASLLEGVMIRSSTVPAIGRFPALKLREIQQLLADDLSSWRNELFVASLDSAILVYQATNKVPVPDSDSAGLPVTHADEVCRGCGDGELRTVRELHFPQRLVPYEDYWKCLALGLQYIIELRWGALWIARSTTKDLGDLADLMEGTIEDRPPEKVKQLVQNLALTTRLLSHLRDASIPLSIAGAGYAGRKYEHLIRVSGLRETISNAEKNIEGLNSFLNHHEAQGAQLRAQKVGHTVGWAGGLMALLAILATIPSMWVDFAENSSLWHFIGTPVAGQEKLLLALLMIISVIFIGAGVGAWRKLSRLLREK